MQDKQVAHPAGGLASLFEQHRTEVLRFIFARCGNREDAEDLLQDMWIRLQGLSSGPIASPRAYLFRMANNLVLDGARTRRRAMRRDHAWLDLDGGPPCPPDERIDPAETADERIAREQEAQVLRRAVQSLPDGAGRALRLYRFEGLGQSEIARIMGISRSGVEKHLALAMKKLRDAMADSGFFDAAASEEKRARRQGGAAMDQNQ